jgi:phage tail P2-like protein
MNLSNISILDLMPPNLAADKNIKMMAESFDEVLRGAIEKIPDIGVISNLALNKIVNEILIDLLAWQFHVDFYEPGLPIETKHQLVLKSLDWHFRKGTPSAVEEIVSTVFTMAEIQEWYEYGGRPYNFHIATAEQMPDAETRKKLMRAIASVKNTRSFLEKITNLLDFIEDPIEIRERAVIEAAAGFVDSLESHDAFGMKSEIILADHVYGCTAIVYGGGIQGGAQYNSVYIHNGSLSYQREVIRYLHNGEIAFGSGLNDIFASEDLSAALHVDLRDEMPSREEFAVNADAEHADRFSAANDLFELSPADVSDLSDAAAMSDDFAIGMAGYRTYGGEDNPKYKHDGSIGYNYGIIAPV